MSEGGSLLYVKSNYDSTGRGVIFRPGCLSPFFLPILQNYFKFSWENSKITKNLRIDSHGYGWAHGLQAEASEGVRAWVRGRASLGLLFSRALGKGLTHAPGHALHQGEVRVVDLGCK